MIVVVLITSTTIWTFNCIWWRLQFCDIAGGIVLLMRMSSHFIKTEVLLKLFCLLMFHLQNFFCELKYYLIIFRFVEYILNAKEMLFIFNLQSFQNFKSRKGWFDIQCLELQTSSIGQFVCLAEHRTGAKDVRCYNETFHLRMCSHCSPSWPLQYPR